jgi:hypothetical protein
VLRRVSQRREWSTAIGRTLSGRILKHHFDYAIHGKETVVFLRPLVRPSGGPRIVLWDRLYTPRAAEVKEVLAELCEIVIEGRPPYFPDLNAEEGCHGDIKQPLRNATPETVEEMRASGPGVRKTASASRPLARLLSSRGLPC